MRDQYDKLAIDREIQELEEKKNWIKEVERLAKEEFLGRILVGFSVTSTDYYNNIGVSPRDFLEDLANICSFDNSIIDEMLD